MSKKESPLNALSSFLPEGCLEDVMLYLEMYKVHLTITRERKSVLGDYRNKVHDKNHRISINGNLNKFAFLITLLHELAHLLTHEAFGHKVSPHGIQWKNEFSKILAQFIRKKVFPSDIEKVLMKTLGNPAASSCADEHLMRILRNYDPRKEGVFLVEELPDGSLFIIAGGKIFQKGVRMRKRFRCTEVATGKVYLFSPVYEVSKAV